MHSRINLPSTYIYTVCLYQGRTQGGCTGIGCTCIPPPPPPVHPPLSQPERLVMRKDEAVGNKKKMQVCLPKHNYKLVNNLFTVEWAQGCGFALFWCESGAGSGSSSKSWCGSGSRSRSGGGGVEGVGQPKMCIPPGKILGTPLACTHTLN